MDGLKIYMIHLDRFSEISKVDTDIVKNIIKQLLSQPIFYFRYIEPFSFLCKIYVVSFKKLDNISIKIPYKNKYKKYILEEVEIYGELEDVYLKESDNNKFIGTHNIGYIYPELIGGYKIIYNARLEVFKSLLTKKYKIKEKN